MLPDYTRGVDTAPPAEVRFLVAASPADTGTDNVPLADSMEVVGDFLYRSPGIVIESHRSFNATVHGRAIAFKTGSEKREVMFRKYLGEWRTETAMLSDAKKILMHPAHYKIIAMGRKVLPLIFRDLAKGGGHWYVALESLTLANPVLPESRATAALIRRDWLSWGREHGYLPA